MAYIAVAVGIFLLIKGGDIIDASCSSLIIRFSIPKIVRNDGSFFSDLAPELIVSIQSALSGHPDLALGNGGFKYC